MLIRVRYTTGTDDHVSYAILDSLIQENKITQFFRSGAWATIGVDPVRINDMASAYTGPERRGVRKMVSFGVGLAKPLFKKALCVVLICVTFLLSTLFGTVLSAMFLRPVDDLEDPYSQAEIDVHPGNHTR